MHSPCKVTMFEVNDASWAGIAYFDEREVLKLGMRYEVWGMGYEV